MTSTIKAINTTSASNDKIFAVFNDADNAACAFYERLIKLGIISKEQARPYAIAWASAKYATPSHTSRKGGGETLPKDSAAMQAVKRVLSRCFENVPSDKISKAVMPKEYTALQNSTADKFIGLFSGDTKRQQMRAAQSMLTQLLREVK